MFIFYHFFASNLTGILNAQKGIPQTANGKRQTSNCGLQSVGNLDLKVSIHPPVFALL